MAYKRILTVQDISCVGQCSLTVALPILSACGLETAVLPSAVLSTHTTGFSGYTLCDLTEEMPRIADHWQREGIRFDALYTGYLAGAAQIDQVKALIATCLQPGAVTVVDPAMADNGRLYPGFDDAFVEKMRSLCAVADILLPNLTEACLLTGTPYQERHDGPFIEALCRKLTALGAKTVVLTGACGEPDKNGVAVFENGTLRFYAHRHIARGCHGTGDVYASAFTGALLGGRTVFDAAAIAADYTVRCIENTQDDPAHWYGVKFEPVLPWLMEALQKNR